MTTISNKYIELDNLCEECGLEQDGHNCDCGHDCNHTYLCNDCWIEALVVTCCVCSRKQETKCFVDEVKLMVTGSQMKPPSWGHLICDKCLLKIQE